MKAHIACVFAVGCTASGTDQFIQPSADCRATASNEFRTRFTGSQLTSFDGSFAVAVTSIETISGVTCRAANREVVANGSFTTLVENQRDEAVYPLLGVFIDSNGNGACDADRDIVWHIYGSVSEAEDLVELTGESFALQPDAEGCALLR